MTFNENELENQRMENGEEQINEEAVENESGEAVQAEELTETVEETPADDVELTQEEPTEEMAEDESNEDDKVEEEAAEPDSENVIESVEEATEDKKKNVSAPIIGAIVVVAVLIIAIVGFLISANSGNPYNKLGYANPSGNTVKDVAESMGITVEQFLQQFGLPEDMPEDTTESAAFYSIPLKNIASMYGMDVDTLKEALNVPAETTVTEPKTFTEKIAAVFKKEEPVAIDENTPWGIVEGELTLGDYYGEQYLEEFKEYYGLGEDVTAETRYKEVRDIIDQKTLEMMAEQEMQNEENTDSATDEENADNAENTENQEEQNTADEQNAEDGEQAE